MNREQFLQTVADAHGADTRAQLQRLHLPGMDLEGTFLRDADLTAAWMPGANLRGADLSRSDLQGADLRGANLKNASLVKTNLRNANLRGADLRNAKLEDADLEGADLAGTLWSEKDTRLHAAADTTYDYRTARAFDLVKPGETLVPTPSQRPELSQALVEVVGTGVEFGYGLVVVQHFDQFDDDDDDGLNNLYTYRSLSEMIRVTGLAVEWHAGGGLSQVLARGRIVSTTLPDIDKIVGFPP